MPAEGEVTLELLYRETQPNRAVLTKDGPFCDLLSLVCDEEYILRDLIPELTWEERKAIAKWASVCHVAAGIDWVSLGRPEEPPALAKIMLRPGRRVVTEDGAGVVTSYGYPPDAGTILCGKRAVVTLDNGTVIYPELKEIIGVE